MCRIWCLWVIFIESHAARRAEASSVVKFENIPHSQSSEKPFCNRWTFRQCQILRKDYFKNTWYSWYISGFTQSGQFSNLGNSEHRVFWILNRGTPDFFRVPKSAQTLEVMIPPRLSGLSLNASIWDFLQSMQSDIFLSFLEPVCSVANPTIPPLWCWHPFFEIKDASEVSSNLRFGPWNTIISLCACIALRNGVDKNQGPLVFFF